MAPRAVGAAEAIEGIIASVADNDRKVSRIPLPPEHRDSVNGHYKFARWESNADRIAVCAIMGVALPDAELPPFL